MGVKAWITVRGNHIPIMDGESKASAIGRFIKDKRNKYNKKVIKTADMIAAGGTEANPRHRNYPRTQKQFEDDLKTATKYYDKNIYKPTIKGRAKTWRERAEERKNEAIDEAYKKYSKLERREQRERAADAGYMAFYNTKKGVQDKTYKLKEDKRTLSRMETAKEIKDRTLKRYNDAKAAHYDSTVDGYKLYDSGLTKALNKARKENDKDLPKLERAIKYQGYIAADGTNKMKVYKSEKLAKELQRRRNIDDAFKAVYGVGLDEFNKTYKKKK